MNPIKAIAMRAALLAALCGMSGAAWAGEVVTVVHPFTATIKGRLPTTSGGDNVTSTLTVLTNADILEAMQLPASYRLGAIRGGFGFTAASAEDLTQSFTIVALDPGAPEYTLTPVGLAIVGMSDDQRTVVSDSPSSNTLVGQALGIMIFEAISGGPGAAAAGPTGLIVIGIANEQVTIDKSEESPPSVAPAGVAANVRSSPPGSLGIFGRLDGDEDEEELLSSIGHATQADFAVGSDVLAAIGCCFLERLSAASAVLQPRLELLKRGRLELPTMDEIRAFAEARR